MRKQKKEEILEIVNTLQSAVGEIEERIAAGRCEEAENLLADCQAAAIAVGNTIEKWEKKETGAVAFLEELCEQIYGCSVAASEQEKYHACKTMRQTLEQIHREIKNGIKEEKLVVFLPYKASMWDSLESVWKAADRGEEWISVVMPIPYFNKKPDGTLGEMQYEGNDFPADVSVTDWQQFSLEREHPDIIFIHNPYDQYNYVTTIHPLFYSSKIKQYTDKLVYIPYFIHQNETVKDNYCVLPGTIYADVVVLQSEKVKDQYVYYYGQEFADLIKKPEAKTIEDKFQAWGSPKYDTSDEGEDCIPVEWKEYIGNGDRKVIFFNTHLSGLMKGRSELFFKKLKWVFAFFKERKDTVLLWRPHPLSLDTARSMNPDAVAPYLSLVEAYQKEKIGIYDESKDLHRAVNLADAYYGDQSSVVELFRQQKKPIMIMEYTVLGD